MGRGPVSWPLIRRPDQSMLAAVVSTGEGLKGLARTDVSGACIDPTRAARPGMWTTVLE